VLMYVCLKCYVIGIDCCSSYYDLHVSVAGTGELYEMFALQRAHGMGPFLDMGQVDTLWAFAWRCINCGEVVDAVIRNHRLCRSHLAVAHEKTDRATISPLSTLQQTRPSRTCHTYAAGLNACRTIHRGTSCCFRLTERAHRRENKPVRVRDRAMAHCEFSRRAQVQYHQPAKRLVEDGQASRGRRRRDFRAQTASASFLDSVQRIYGIQRELRAMPKALAPTLD
jgi:hypothetical protein